MADDPRVSDAAFTSTLVGGVLILVGGLGMTMMMAPLSGGMMGGMMGPYANDAAYGWATGFWPWWMLGVGVVSGALVLYAATRMRTRPDEGTRAGILAIVGGALSLLAMGGFLLGAIAAIVGGALALTSGSARVARPG